MAEAVLKKLTRTAGVESEFEIASAATTPEELGNPVYPMARQELAKHGIGCPGHKARLLDMDDYEHYDLIVGMDTENVEDMQRFFLGDPLNKLFRLLDFTDSPRDIADPWYTRDFRSAWNDIYAGCTALFNKLSDGGATA